VAVAVVAGLVAVCWPAQAQLLEQYFAPGVPGYGTEQGVTVLSRLRPLYDSSGVRVGDFTVRPSLDESVGYDSNPFGLSGGSGSALIHTAPSVSARSDWSRDSLGAAVSLDNYAYLDQPSQNRTDVSASLGGGYTIGRSDLDLGYSYLSLHATANQVGALAASVPTHYTVHDLRSDYSIDLGRVSFVPNVDVSRYSFDPAVIDGVAASQRYRDRVVGTGGVTTRYELSDQHDLLLVLQGVDSHYTNPQPGEPTNNSTSELALAGIDYQASGVWRYRLLAGIEHRDFAAAAFKSRTEPVAELAAIWTPTGLTTVTGTASRSIEEPSAEGTSGFVEDTVGLVVDHEYLRNVLLQGRAGVQAAQYMGGGSDTSYSVGGGVTWLLNRRVRLSANYDYNHQHGSSSVTQGGQLTPVELGSGGLVGTSLASGGVVNPNTITSGSYTDSLFLLTLHFGL
jgi:hypothetical protein